MLDTLSADAVDTVIAVFEASPMLLMAELRHIGGEAGRAKHGNGALAKLDAGFVFFAAGMSVPEIAEPVRAQLEAVKAAVDVHANGRNYSNFTEAKADAGSFFGAAAYARLQAVKSVYDPGGVFRANHEIPQAA